jgi:hypothetical protein
MVSFEFVKSNNFILVKNYSQDYKENCEICENILNIKKIKVNLFFDITNPNDFSLILILNEDLKTCNIITETCYNCFTIIYIF